MAQFSQIRTNWIGKSSWNNPDAYTQTTQAWFWDALFKTLLKKVSKKITLNLGDLDDVEVLQALKQTWLHPEWLRTIKDDDYWENSPYNNHHRIELKHRGAEIYQGHWIEES